MRSTNKVYGYFTKNNYDYINELKYELQKDNINASKSKIIELGVKHLRNTSYEQIKQEIGDMVSNNPIKEP